MILTLGEIMLRLKSPGKEKLIQAAELEVSYGGGEANVAVGLSRLGHKAVFASVLPDNALADGALQFLRGQNVETRIQRTPGRMGLYFLQEGGSQRPSKVLYDRENSAFSLTHPDAWNWDETFQGVQWLHLTGITPALSESCRDLTIRALAEAQNRKIRVSLDLNFRKNLWNYGKKAQEVMPQLLDKVDYLVANEEDLQNSLGTKLHSNLDVEKGEIDFEAYKALGSEILKKHPRLQGLALTLRESINADHNRWSGVFFTPTEIVTSRNYDIYPIVDRVGAGDAFCAGLIAQLVQGTSSQKALDYAVAVSCLKHSIKGDQALVDPADVETLLSGDESGRVQR